MCDSLVHGKTTTQAQIQSGEKVKNKSIDLNELMNFMYFLQGTVLSPDESYYGKYKKFMRVNDKIQKISQNI